MMTKKVSDQIFLPDRHVHIIYLTFLTEEIILDSSAIILKQMES